jgi:hypothetical protein
MIKIFQNLALFRVKNAIFFAKFLGENIFKIITSVPDQSGGEFFLIENLRVPPVVVEKYVTFRNKNIIFTITLNNGWTKILQHGCQIVYFQTKNPNLGKFWRVLQWKMFVYFMSIWSILLPFGIFYTNLVHFLVIWYIFPVLVCGSKKNLATLYCNSSPTLFRTVISRVAKWFIFIHEFKFWYILRQQAMENFELV